MKWGLENKIAIRITFSAFRMFIIDIGFKTGQHLGISLLQTGFINLCKYPLPAHSSS
jgi:hypothetical protein